LLLVVIGLLLVPAAAQATTITVHSTADSLTGCTLRNAIIAANQNSAHGACAAGQQSPTVDKIDFAVPAGSTITLASTLPAINGPLDIVGPGQAQLNVSGADAHQVLKVNSAKTVSISGLTISHGNCDSAACDSMAQSRLAGRHDGHPGPHDAERQHRHRRRERRRSGGMHVLAGTYTIKSSTIVHNSATFGANLQFGGPGADTFKGGNGNDTLVAHDLASDILIDCDGGTKPGTADKADLDLLPKDPNSIVHGCETATRN
jgi:hypothetical protein